MKHFQNMVFSMILGEILKFHSAMPSLSHRKFVYRLAYNSEIYLISNCEVFIYYRDL